MTTDTNGILLNLSPLDIYLVTLPLSPPSLYKGGGIGYVREAKPLFDSPLVCLFISAMSWR